MNKRILAAALALLCALTLCLTALPVFADGEGDPATTNVAAGATVTVSGNQYNNDPGSNWGTQFLVDGSKAAGGILLMPGGNMFAPVTEPIDITLDLGGVCTIYSVDLYDAYNGAETGNPFAMPEAYVIAVSDDGVDFTPVATVTDGVNNVTQHTIPFDTPATGSYLRLTITKGCTADLTGAGQSFCAVGELEAQGVRLQSSETTAPDAGGSEESTAPDAGNTPPANLRNVALNVPVEATSGQIHNDPTAWGTVFLVDGVKIGTGDSASGLLLAPGGNFLNPVTAPIDITLDLGGVCTIYSVNLYDAYGGGYALPQGYIISVSDDGVDFTPVTTITDGDQYTAPHIITFDTPATGSYLRLTVTNGCDANWGDGMSFCAIGEMEVWGTMEDAIESETTAPSTPVIPPVPDAGNDETEAETEDETIVETVVETEAPKAETEAPKAETKAPETAAPAADTADEGCASVVGIGAVAVLTAAAAAVVLKKKD